MVQGPASTLPITRRVNDDERCSQYKFKWGKNVENSVFPKRIYSYKIKIAHQNFHTSHL